MTHTRARRTCIITRTPTHLHHCHTQEGDAGRAAFESARAAAGLGLTVTARLGRRTKYQEKALPQMVLLAKSARPAPLGGKGGGGGEVGDSQLPVARGHGSDSILLEATAFAAAAEEAAAAASSSAAPSAEGRGETEEEGAVDGKLHPLEQAVVLALCLEVGAGQARGADDGGLTSEQVRECADARSCVCEQRSGRGLWPPVADPRTLPTYNRTSTSHTQCPA